MTTLTTPLADERTRSERLFRAGAWCWIVTGTAHNLIDVYLRFFPRAQDQVIDDLMRAHPVDMLGLHRTYYGMNMGFSLAMGLCMIFVGVLLLWVGRLSAQGVRQVAAAGLGMSALALGISVWLEPPPPIVTFSLACIAFGLSIRGSNEVRR